MIEGVQAKLVRYGHSKGVHMGWYLNGCACGEGTRIFGTPRGSVVPFGAPLVHG